MSNILNPEDYEKLYEDALWRLQQANNDTTTDQQARVLLARAYLNGILQQQASKSSSSSRRIRESAAALQHVFRINSLTTAAAKGSPMADKDGCSLGLLVALPLQQPPATWKENCLARHFSANVDDFFEAYPESMRQHNDDDESSSSSSEDEQVFPRPKKQQQPQPHSQSQQQQQQQQQVVEIIDVDSSSRDRVPETAIATTSERRSLPWQPDSSLRQPAVNPYARSKKPTPAYPPEQQQQQTLERSSSSRSQQSNTGFSHTPVESDFYTSDNQSSWDDVQRKNPFQTAREFSAIQDKRQQARPQQQRCTRPVETTHEPPTPEPVQIPESLKRKFQPPKRNGTQGSKPAAAAAAATKKGATTQKHQDETKNNDNGDDDDELPEQLKRFGKELVKKIEDEILDSGDPITFQDIAGLQDAKQTIQEVICWPMKRPDLFTGLRKAPNGLLLYGPPGTGKTLIGKAIAHESGATFFAISSSSLTSKWIGEGEKLVRTMFAVAAYREPSVVFIDEIDSLLTQRKADENEASRRIKTEFLVQLDGTGTAAQGRVLTIGATNRPQELDEAARRRFIKRLYIPLPIESDRETLLQVLLSKNNHRLTEAEISKLARETDGYSGADLKSLCTDAAMGPIRQLGARALQVEATDVPPISYKHFRQSLRSMKPSVAPGDLVQYEEWDAIYGSKRIEDEVDDESDDDNQLLL